MKEKKKNIKKVIALTLIIIGILITIIGLYIQLANKEKIQNQENKKDTPEEILTKLSIDKYLKLALNSNIETNKNILDVNSDQDMMLYFYSSNAIKHYRIHFMDYVDGKPLKFVYARYDEYQKEHQKVFGIKPNLILEGNDLKMTDVVQVSGDDYKVNSGNVGPCDEKTNPTECYIMLTKYSENTNTIKFDNLSMKNNIINGNAIVNLKDNITLNATFEFEYKKDNGNYIIKSLIIKSINN